MDLEELFKKLSNHDSTDIRNLSLRIEYQKIDLARNIKNKKLYLALVNVALMQEANLYAFAGGILEDNRSIKESIKEMRDAAESFLESLNKLGKDLSENKKGCDYEENDE